MSFFQDSRAVTIHGGDFKSFTISPESADLVVQSLGKRKERDDSDFDADTRKRRRYINKNLDGLKIIKADDIILGREMISGHGYRIHYASHKKRVVLVKTFEGESAKEDWLSEVALAKGLFHPNVLKMVGISYEGSETPFVVFHGIISEQRMQLLIANALATDLNLSIQLSMKVVKGLAAALHYMKTKKKISLQRISENFHIFVGYDDEPVIAFHQPSTIYDDDSQTFNIEDDGRDIEALNGICRKIFSESNSILHGDSPDRNFYADDAEGAMTAILTDLEGSATFSEDVSYHTAISEIIQTPRREVCWVDLDETNQSLESIKRCFEDCLDRFLLSPSVSPLRHINAPKVNYSASHSCSGYLRVEIALTSDISKSAIVSHSSPSQSERCSICRQIVRYTNPSAEKHGNSSFNVNFSAQSTSLQSYPEFRDDESCNDEMKSNGMEGNSNSSLEIPHGELAVGSLLKDVEMDCIGASTLLCEERDLQEATENGSEVDVDALMVIAADEIDLHKELLSGDKYQIHSASYEGRAVAVKVFEDKQKWAVNLHSKKLRHPHIAQLGGVSDSDPASPFVVFNGVSDKRMQSIIANALRTDLSKSVQLSMRVVQGLADALSYLKKQKIPLHSAWETFDVLAGSHDEPLIAIDWPSTVYEDSCGSHFEGESSGLKALNGLCQKLFSETNSILYGGLSGRKVNANAAARLLKSAESGLEVTSGISEHRMPAERSLLKTMFGQTPRREVWWIDLGAKNQSLDSIQRRFSDYMSYFLSSPNRAPLRRLRASEDVNSRQNLHRCPGYLREEIALTSEVARCAIISHEYPSQSEICSVCGQLCSLSDTSETDLPEGDSTTDIEGSPDEVPE